MQFFKIKRKKAFVYYWNAEIFISSCFAWYNFEGIMVLILFKGAFSDLRLFLMTESPLKMIKMLFISLKKLFSFLKYLNFCSDLLVM